METKEKFNKISTPDLQRWMAEGRPMVLIDTLASDHYRRVSFAITKLTRKKDRASNRHSGRAHRRWARSGIHQFFMLRDAENAIGTGVKYF
jgi:hypothetical protein